MANAPIAAAQGAYNRLQQWEMQHPNITALASIVGGLLAGDGEVGEPAGEFNQYENITRPGSINNVQTNVTPTEFGANLEASGFKKTTAGNVTIYVKGDTQYTVYPTATSTGGPTAQVKVAGQVVGKIRLQ